MSETCLTSVNFHQLTSGLDYYKSPSAWEDRVLYFLMLDRFSDNREKGYKDVNGKAVSVGTTPMFKLSDNQNAVQTEADATKWRDAGGKYLGGSINGLKNKLGYLKRLGVTAIWISPIFKQVEFQETYHGYGIQNFLQVNPRFGTSQEF
ncbi:MAG: alpha-amylase family glycosyl hydrolase, partial [Methylococcaceae bacterium]